MTYHQKKTDEISAEDSSNSNDLHNKMAKASLDEKKSP